MPSVLGASRTVLVAAIAAVVLAGCLGEAPNGAYTVTVADGVRPRLSAADAVAITRSYLDEQRGELAAPELHADPHILEVWAVQADDARKLDGCIPPQTSTGVVWVTRGTGDYLNLKDHAWSHMSQQIDDPIAIACEGPGPAGIVVIDDGSGEILGVYPLVGDLYPHPTPA
ncbi:MAG TPA: hypothetical protein VE011_07030 [Candidatus Dormibacteraeota bacterium]|nr:hypothetical protein [Candidatus Dormibacteraeota bacterium]